MADDPAVDVWFKRISESEDVFKKWEEDFRIADCYQFWRGNALEKPTDAQGERKIQVNIIHPMVRSEIPRMYFYRPFARVEAAPEKADTPRSKVDEKRQLLQDTGNHFVRDKGTDFRPATFMALKESFWAFGVVEVGYSPYFEDTGENRPPLKESEDTEVAAAGGEGDDVDETAVEQTDAEILAEITRLRKSLRSEQFYVKHISAKQVLISGSDRAILDRNDWVGYWEEFALEDVKKSPAYKNKRNLKASNVKEGEEPKEGVIQKIRLYKIWDLRTKTKFVLAQGHKKFLLKEKFQRCPLKFYRPDVDPYHFFPIPLIYQGLGEQVEHNDVRGYLQKVRKGTVPRYTYDEDAVKPDEMDKFRSGDVGVFIPRKANTPGTAISPVEQPTQSGLAMQTLALSERSFAVQTGVPAEARQTLTTGGSKTATQAKLQATAANIEDSFDREQFAEFLAEIINEIILLAIDHMNLPKWIAVNVDPDSPLALQEGLKVAQTFKEIQAEKLASAAMGLRWEVKVDVESLSPASENEQLPAFMQIMTMLGNPYQAALLKKVPGMLNRLLALMGLKGSADQDALRDALDAVIEMRAMEAARGAGAGPGIAPMGGLPTAGGPPPLPEIPGNLPS